MKLLRLATLLLPFVLGAWTQAVDFRATSAGITDCNKCAVEIGTTSYPRTPTCNGCASAGDSTAIGWTTAACITGNTRDRSGTDPQLFGMNFKVANGTGCEFKIALPATGNYTVILALGDNGGAQNAEQAIIKDSTTTLATIAGTVTSTALGSFLASDSTVYTHANWMSTGITKTVTVTMTGTVMSIWVGINTGGNNDDAIAFVQVDQVSSGTTPPPPLLPLMGVGVP